MFVSMFGMYVCLFVCIVNYLCISLLILFICFPFALSVFTPIRYLFYSFLFLLIYIFMLFVFYCIGLVLILFISHFTDLFIYALYLLLHRSVLS